MGGKPRPRRVSSVNAEHIDRWTARLREARARRDSLARQLAATDVEVVEIRKFLSALRDPSGAGPR